MKKILYICILLCGTFCLVACNSKPTEKNKNEANYSPSSDRQTISVGIAEWMPYYGEEMENGGPLVELTQEALKRAGYSQNVIWMPFVRGLELAKLGKIDATAAVLEVEERKDYLLYPEEPLCSAKTYLFVLKKSGIKYTNLEEMQKYSLTRERASLIGEKIINNPWKSTDLVNSRKQMIRLLMSERVDIAAAFELPFRENFRKLYPHLNFDDVIDTIGPAQVADKLYIAFSKANPHAEEISAKFSEAFREMKQDGTYNKIIEPYGFELYTAESE